MQLLDKKIEKIIEAVKKEFNLSYREWYLKKRIIDRISFNDLEKVIFNKITISEKWEVNISQYFKNKKLKWLYGSQWNNKLIDRIKQSFISKFVEEIKFCPYCWKTPLIYFDDEKEVNIWFIKIFKKLKNIYSKFRWFNKPKRSFQLDHFFPKSKEKYEVLSMNLYNLVPSCYHCNNFKKDDNPLKEEWKIFHPYFWWIKNKWSKIKIQTKDFDCKINFKNKNIFKEKHFKYFRLDKIYSNSQDTKNDIWFIRDKIEKIKTDKMNLNDLGLSSKFNLDERKDLFFKNFYPKSEQDILKFANWKLKKDLIENINL